MVDPTLFFIITLLLLILFALSWFAGLDAPYVPTDQKVIRKILKLAGVKKGKKFLKVKSKGFFINESLRMNPLPFNTFGGSGRSSFTSIG